MNKITSLKIASITLIVHGVIEIFGALILVFTPSEFIPLSIGRENTIFWAIMSTIYGVSRLIAGYMTWLTKKWGIVFGIALSITTMTVALSIIPFGVMDSILAIIALTTTLYAWFGDEELFKS